MALNPVARAIFKRDLKRWFGNPTGYVFITLFVLLLTCTLFWSDSFFQKNLANLDTLFEWFMPGLPAAPFLLLLLLFVPAITMTVWAGERGQKTDELLLTLPASDFQVILAKFLAAAGIYTVALVFTLPILLFLFYLGSPDPGLMLCNYAAFWLIGLVLISAGMAGSMLSDNLTVAFIFGCILCGAVVMSDWIMELVLPTGVARALVGFGPVSRFQDMGRGVFSLSSLLLFAGLTAAFLYLNLLLLSRRRWYRKGFGVHLGVRFACVIVSAVALTAVGANAAMRGDLTQENLHSLSPETVRLIDALPDDRTITIEAFVSPSVPADYVRTRRTLLDLLREFDARGGDRVRVRVVDTERFSDAAREAQRNYGITHQSRYVEEDGRMRPADLFLGVTFTCGLEEVVIPFFDRGLPVEYELTRSLRVVSSAERRRVGVLDNDLKVFGGFDFQTMRQDREWEIVRELKLQYDVVRVDPASQYPTDLDVLVALMPSSLTLPEMDTLSAYLEAGNPTLLIDDPFPVSAPGMAPSDPKGGARNPLSSMQQQQQQPEAKGDIRALLQGIGIDWVASMSRPSGFQRGTPSFAPSIAWDVYNPHPQFEFEPEIVFIGSPSNPDAFNPSESITAGLQELVVLFGGAVRDISPPEITFTPLLQTSNRSGIIEFDEMFRTDPFFMGRSINPARRHRPDGQEQIVACRVQNDIDVIFVADLDLVSQNFFEIRRQGLEDMRLDNVTFLLNCVDALAADESFIVLRKRRPQHRTLTRIENEQRIYNDEWLRQKQEAEEKAQQDLAAARRRLDERIAEIEKRTDLDEQSKAIRIESVREVEQRRLDVREAAIEDEKNKAMEQAQSNKLREENRIRDVYRFGSAAIVPIPAILVAIFTLLRRNRRERDTVRSIDTERVSS